VATEEGYSSAYDAWAEEETEAAEELDASA
jgi:hypothetical protein